MKSFKILLRRMFLYNKRLFKKPGFVAILLLIPILVAALTLAVEKDPGSVMTVALACEDNEDALAREISDSLLAKPSLIRFVPCNSPAEAGKLVEGGKADAAWIFREDMRERLDKFTGHINARNAFVTVLCRENNVLLQLTYEKLGAALYPYLSQSLYGHFVRENIALESLTDEQLATYYRSITAEGSDLFRISYADGSAVTKTNADQSYLLAPLRGLLAILIGLCGLAVSLYYMQDTSAGRFDQITKQSRPLVATGYHLLAVADVAVVVVLTLLITGMSVSLGRELLAMFLYVLMTVGFCLALQQLFHNIRVISSLIPVIILALLVVCPVFINIVLPPALRYLFPTYYYLNAIHDVRFIYRMLLYIAIIFGFDYLIYRVRNRG